MNTTTQRTTAPSRARQLWTAVRDDLADRRRHRAEYLELKRELTAYSTRAEVDDLLGSIEDQDGAEAELIRTILTNNLQQRSHQLAS